MALALDGTTQHARPEAPWIRIDPDRDRVRVRCGGALDGVAAVQLRRDCIGLVERGFDRVIVDLSETTEIGPGVVSAIAAVNRRARARGCRLSLAPGSGSAAATLRRAGLLAVLQLEGVNETFLDWSR